MFGANDDIKDLHSLWQRFTEGDRLAFDALIKRHYMALFTYGLKFTKDKELLKDVVHDAFVSVWQNRHLVNPDKQPYFYLLTIFRNQLVKSLKTTLIFDETPFENLTEESIETQLIQLEDTSRIRFLIKKLPFRHREALHLRFFEELDNDQIAELMQINKQSIANLIHSGLKMLRKMWEVNLLVPLVFAFF